MIEIVKKHKDYVIIYKPPGIPTQPDPTGDQDAMTLTAALLSECGELVAESLGGTRLCGVLFALGQNFHPRVQSLAADGKPLAN